MISPMPDNDPEPITDETKPLPAETPDRGVQAADAAIETERGGAAAPEQDIDRAATAGREGGTR